MGLHTVYSKNVNEKLRDGNNIVGRNDCSISGRRKRIVYYGTLRGDEYLLPVWVGVVGHERGVEKVMYGKQNFKETGGGRRYLCTILKHVVRSSRYSYI